MRVSARRFGSRHNRRNWSHFRIIFSVIVFFLVVASVLVSWVIDLRITPVVESWAIQRAKNIGTRAISNSVQEIMAGQIQTTDLVVFQRDGANRIAAVQLDMGAINRIVSMTTTRIQDSLNVMKDEILPVPIGQILGFDFLAGWGPRIPVKIIPVGAVDTIPRQKFSHQGINQTLYRMYLEVRTNMRVVVPFIPIDVPVISEVPLVETILKGDVPSVYFNGTPDLSELERFKMEDNR